MSRLDVYVRAARQRCLYYSSSYYVRMLRQHQSFPKGMPSIVNVRFFFYAGEGDTLILLQWSKIPRGAICCIICQLQKSGEKERFQVVWVSSSGAATAVGIVTFGHHLGGAQGGNSIELFWNEFWKEFWNEFGNEFVPIFILTFTCGEADRSSRDKFILFLLSFFLMKVQNSPKLSCFFCGSPYVNERNLVLHFLYVYV